MSAERLAAAGLRVKPLEWEEQDGKSYRQANCVLGQYQVSWLIEFECWQLSRPHISGAGWRDNLSRHSSKDDAKAAAQADCEARIYAALTPASDGRAEALLAEAVEALRGLRNIVEGIDGAMNHGTWRAERSNLRMKDTDEWVKAYNTLARIQEATK